MSRKHVVIKPRDGGNAQVTLFPFLAVLLCTMGALIMLLVIIARNVREQADDDAYRNIPVVASQEEELPDLTEEPETQTTEIQPEEPKKITAEELERAQQHINDGIEEALWFAENLETSKKNALEKRDEQRAWLAAIENHIQKIKEEIERLAALAEQLDKKADLAEDSEKLKQLLRQREEQKNQFEAELERMQKEAGQKGESYAIIPYRGTNGTYRRPIYVECRDNQVIIQPEGLVLTPADFLLGDRPDNPLDSSLRVVRQYLRENNQIERGSEPYPLMVVRPSGVEAYAAVQQAMGSWVNEFGYELIDENWNMEYPPASEELKLRLEKQLETSRTRLQGYLAAMNAQRRAHQKSAPQQYRVDANGEVQAIETPESLSAQARRNRSKSPSMPAQEPRAQNSSGSYDSYSRSTTPGTGTGTGSPTGIPGQTQPSMALNPYSKGSDTAQQKKGLYENYSLGSASQSGSSSGPLGYPPYSQGSPQHSARPGGTVGVGPMISDGVYRPHDTPGAANQFDSTDLFPVQADQGDRKLDLIERPRGPGGSEMHGNVQEQPNLYGFEKPDSLNKEPARTESASQSPYANPYSYPGQKGAQEKGSQQTGTQTGENQILAPASSGNPLAFGLTPDSSGMPVAGISVSTNPAQPMPAEPGQQSYPSGKAGQQKQDLAPLHPSNIDWALRGVQPFSAAVARNVKVQCEADKFVLMPQPGLIGLRVVPIKENVTQSTEKLVQHIWDYMDSWGIAGEKYYWRPVLQVQVPPGGEQRFEELRWLLRDSGFVIEKVQ